MLVKDVDTAEVIPVDDAVKVYVFHVKILKLERTNTPEVVAPLHVPDVTAVCDNEREIV